MKCLTPGLDSQGIVTKLLTDGPGHSRDDGVHLQW